MKVLVGVKERCVRPADVAVIEGAKSFYPVRDGGDWFSMRRIGERLHCGGSMYAERSHVVELNYQILRSITWNNKFVSENTLVYWASTLSVASYNFFLFLLCSS